MDLVFFERGPLGRTYWFGHPSDVTNAVLSGNVDIGDARASGWIPPGYLGNEVRYVTDDTFLVIRSPIDATEIALGESVAEISDELADENAAVAAAREAARRWVAQPWQAFEVPLGDWLALVRLMEMAVIHPFGGPGLGTRAATSRVDLSLVYVRAETGERLQEVTGRIVRVGHPGRLRRLVDVDLQDGRRVTCSKALAVRLDAAQRDGVPRVFLVTSEGQTVWVGTGAELTALVRSGEVVRSD